MLYIFAAVLLAQLSARGAWALPSCNSKTVEFPGDSLTFAVVGGELALTQIQSINQSIYGWVCPWRSRYLCPPSLSVLS